MKSIFFTIYFALFFQVFLQSQTLDATLLELKFSNDGYPEKFTKVDNGFFFSSEDDQLWFSDGTEDNTFLVKDFESGLYDDISSITPVGSKVFFVAENGNDNRELWMSDGTELGTIQLTDRNVGYSTEGIYNIIEYNGKIYFGAYSEVFGNELWVSDGTPEGTFVLKDIAENGNSSPRDFFVFNNKLIFKASTDEYNVEFWTSDGTEEGTVLLKDIREGNQAGAVSLGQVIFNGNFYFFANDGTTGTELWKSDGTPEGTQLLKDIHSGYSGSNNSMIGAVLNNKLLFVANDGVSGNELWETDGTLEGTSLFYDINNGVDSGFEYNGILNLVGDKIFFTGTDGALQSGLWVSDGTSQNTFFLNDASPNLLSGNSTGTFAIYFANDDLWKSDGTVNGTIILSEDIQVTNISVSDQSFLAYDNNIFFNGKNEVNGNELWVTDGTTDGTKLFHDVNHSYGVSPSLLTAVGNQLFFRGNKYGTFGLCTSDGTIEGTRYLSIGSNEGGIDDESEFIDFNGKLVVSANDGVHGYELWISDGTQNGTQMIKDINPGSGSSMYNSAYIKTLYVIDDKLYFMADDGIRGNELWVTDGTENGTYRISDIIIGGGYSVSLVSNVVSYNGFIYFSAVGDNGYALFKTDGQLSGTSKIKDLNRLEAIHVVNNKLVMIAETSGTTYGPHDLWVSDGTTAGTTHLMSFGDGIDSGIQFMTILNDELYFVAKEPSPYYRAVYKTDGTLNGTKLLFSDRNHPFSNLDIDNIISCGNYVYFGVQELFSSNKELWRTDGTLDGTIAIINEEEGVFNSIDEFTCYKENLLFKQFAYPSKLWLTTGQVNEVYDFDINVTNGSSDLNSFLNFTAVNDNIFFESHTYESGHEIYVTSLDLSILSIEENVTVNDANNIRVIAYPNPISKGQVSIKASNNDIIDGFDIYDISGKKLISKSNKGLLEKLPINVEALSSGIYILNVTIEDKGRFTTKFLVE